MPNWWTHLGTSGEISWLRWIISVIFIAVAFRIVLSLVINRLFHSFRVRSVGWHFLEGIEWKQEVAGRKARVDIQRVRWFFERQRDGRSARLGIRFEGVRAHIPRSLLDRSPKTEDTDGNAAGVSGTPVKGIILIRQALLKIIRSGLALRPILLRPLNSLPRPVNRLIIRSFRFLRYRLIRPALARTNAIGRALSFTIAYFVIDMADVHIDIEDIMRVRLSARVGLELLRGRESRAGAYLCFAGVAVEEWESHGDVTPVVLAVPGPITFAANAPFDPAIGLAGLYKRNQDRQIDVRQGIIDVSVNFPFTHQSASREAANVRLDALGRLLSIFRAESSQSGTQESRNSPPPSPQRQRTRYVSALRRVSCSLPPIRVSYLHFPSSSRTPDDNKASRTPVTIVAIAEGLGFDVEFNCVSKTDDRHLGWFGKERKLKVRGQAGWRNWQVGFDVGDHGLFYAPGCLFSVQWLTDHVLA
jgi:hypothetical protein